MEDDLPMKNVLDWNKWRESELAFVRKQLDLLTDDS